MLGEQPRTYQGPTQALESAGTLTFDLDDLTDSSGSEKVSLPLDAHDAGQIHQWSSQDQLNPQYDMNLEPESVKRMLQYDMRNQMGPLTCDPRDLIKK